jgi:hypothetical protein
LTALAPSSAIAAGSGLAGVAKFFYVAALFWGLSANVFSLKI